MTAANHDMSRRGFLLGAGAIAVAAASGVGAPSALAATSTPRRGVVPLPTAGEMRAGIQQMVDCGPRLPGSPEHDRWLALLENGFQAAGLQLMPCDEYAFTRWVPQQFRLEILDGPTRGPVRIATAIVRSAGTDASGVTGPLVYGGTLPALSLDGVDFNVAQAAIAAYPQQVAAWVQALPSQTKAQMKDGILLVDLPSPVPLTLAAFAPLSTYDQWSGHSAADWAVTSYKRQWLGPYVGLSNFTSLGVKGVIFSIDASYDALHGNFSPHTNPPQPLPGFMVDRDTGAQLRALAGAAPNARMTLIAPEVAATTRLVTAVLPGESNEVIIVSSHSDGQNAYEENGSLAVLAIARHFASLPQAQRLKRTLVFTLFPGHMSGYRLIQDASCFIASHPDLVTKAVASVCMEHLGATEWQDTIDKGYHSTGLPEVHAIWTTQGPMFDLVKAALVQSNLQRHSMLRPPYQITPSYPFHDAGIPNVGGISGPNYLVRVSDNGDMDKLDAQLAADQVRFYADIVRRLDTADKAALRTGDPTLGQPQIDVGNQADGPPTPLPHRVVACGPVAASAAADPSHAPSTAPGVLPDTGAMSVGGATGAALLLVGLLIALRARSVRSGGSG